MVSLDDIQVGDLVNVPGGMYGTVKFIGVVAGKPGRFAGVELAPEHAGRGKNNGDVEGRSYFTTSQPGSGIFVPINNNKYVSKRTTSMGSRPLTPSRPNFSKSVGPGPGPNSMSLNRPKFRRPSLPRPESPRSSPPKLNMAALRTPSAFSKSVGPNGGVPRTPLRTTRPPSRPSSRISVESNTNNTPQSVRRYDTRTPAFDDQEAAERIRYLEKQLRDRDKQLEEQSATLAEFQKSITELEGLDALQVRAQLREKNEKITALTAEFDSHRADFRSTLDTLEVAASETERVYERRLEELMHANRELQERGEDVETVARQLKQLEELVSELEEGLEDARRGEAEARGEVEFLRGEVERTRLELKQEREKPASAIKGTNADAHPSSKDLDQKDDEIRGLKAIIHSLSRGEPVGLHQMNGSSSNNGDHQDADRLARLEHRIQELEGLIDRKSYRIEELERELEKDQNRRSHNRSGTITSSPLKQQHSSPGAVSGSGAVNHTHTLSDRTVVPNDWHDPSTLPNINSNGPNQYSTHFSAPQHHNELIRHHLQQLSPMPESDSHSSSTDDGGVLWCEICETSGHDILTCTNMFGSGAANGNNAGSNKNDGNNINNRAIANINTNTNTHNNNNGNYPNGIHQNNGLGASNKYSGINAGGSPNSQRTGRDVVLEGLKGLTASMSPVAGKASGVIDESKWCALCERDGHESIDCPFED
ncbi:uncharacterized protein PADG_02497 [Paracoccidioides brasiliensis Pb18]|uniref:CAP-Gly domain-containing protein n=1 Tax=Paracoccidioides brasiliensis (strain Pb18) TaxID=502780 RepID=C1G5P2_PARBD|nr:uncharacterized protein PADG_02497 [Paracoccidioides brasiliensis Pb18]EEH46399.1 hypothetical protein PADG_02497 [Paracoccidioides brasiliensis Pb18]